MATTMQLSELRTAVRQRADQVNSQFCSDAELNSYINQSYFELYDLLVQKYGDNYYVAPPVTITTNGTTQLYDLPDGTLYSGAPAVLKLLGVDASLGGSSYVSLKPFNFSERNKYAGFRPVYSGPLSLRYRLNGNQILLDPRPQIGETIRLWYVPRMTQLVADSDTMDGISGWTEYVIVDAAIKARDKEESDVSVLMSQKMALQKRIIDAAEDRDAGSPATVADVRRYGCDEFEY